MSTAASPGQSASPLRLLYVEDNRVNALLLVEALRVLDQVDLRVAEDGDEAIDIASQWHPDMLVLDAHLPGMSGYEVLQRLRAMPGIEGAPAFMCSADASEQDQARARAAGFVGYWAKPIDIDRVVADVVDVASRR